MRLENFYKQIIEGECRSVNSVLEQQRVINRLENEVGSLRSFTCYERNTITLQMFVRL